LYATAEVVPEGCGGAEPAAHGNLLDRARARLEQVLGLGNTEADDPIRWAHSCRFRESSRQRALAHARLTSQTLDGEWLIEVMLCPIEKTGEPGALFVSHWRWNKLRLSTLAMRRHNEAARDDVRNARAMVSPDDVETKVDSRRAPRRGEHAALVYIENVRVDDDPWILAGKRAGVPPVRRRATTVEKARRRQDEHARADRYEARAATMRGNQRIDELRRRSLFGVAPARYDDGVCAP
jgi:hypothetical protein